MRLNQVLKSVAITAVAAMAFSTVQAADITGAGATFPYPIYAKWAEAYQKATGNGLNYQSIGSGGGCTSAFLKSEFRREAVPPC